MTIELEKTIDAAWEERTSLAPSTTGAVRDAVNAALSQLDSGALRVAFDLDQSGCGAAAPISVRLQLLDQGDIPCACRQTETTACCLRP